MKGQCLCGAVRVDSPDAREIGACHCGYCRRWGGGGPMLAVHCGTGLRVEGEAQVGVYASSDWAERAFCTRCGTHLYYKLLPTGEFFVPAGLFDTDDFEITQQIYVDKKPGFYALSNQTPELTEAQVLAQFAPPGDGGAG
ncbi:GFA family protein [uncultured Pseudacidovorax sp.]|uniref:GFA family protein n=1 Tax=uncultured Pseudacidovorax sp. TaxID=679313 RepID=UPI0025DFB8CF|nr:GFA family protein [uncultured Pseudacidovorax sp.]